MLAAEEVADQAQVTELIPSANENKVTKRTMCQNPPLLNTSTLRPRPPG